MLTFEEKLAIIESFPELHKKAVSLGRYNFHFEESVHDKKIVVHHLHPNGNGFVYAGHLPKKATDPKGMVNIREYDADALRKIIRDSIDYLSRKPEPASRTEEEKGMDQEVWVGPHNQTLLLANEDELWNVYANGNLEEAFESYKEAERYLREEGFQPK
ncbi:hypothetical protein NDK47_14040 [Brevibacillus ruminantium]|uniref:Uncharacterized protein n=1 Tax=Brevibacillus ruminantium TaxID=2950604 RepID=A0ABY4WC20_9BACL|nr:hypothetical protein [Brevibacillus ruminantium]USG63310.1 hypothetical protein NDK47_14040 [Brevibacillus ruminantium]